MAKLISKPDFTSSRCFTEYDGGLVEIYEPFATLGFRLTPARQQNTTERIHARRCTLCGEPFRTVHDRKYLSGGIEVTERIHECHACGNWRGVFKTSLSSEEWLVPFIGNFTPQTQIPALTALLDEVRANPKRLFSTTPRQFELFVGSVLSAFMSCDVYHVGRSRDGGVDLIVIGTDRPMMVQVKRRESANAVEGVDVVKLLFASMFVRGASNGLVVTSAQRFSRDATKWIHLPALKDSSFDIDLVAFDRLLQMTRSVKISDSQPWQDAIRFWRAETPHIKFSAAMPGFHDAVTLTVGGASVSLREYLANRDADTYLSVGDDWFVLLGTPKPGRAFAFRLDDRSKCWELPLDTIDAEALPSRIQGMLRAEIDSLHSLDGGDFHRVLSQAPVGFVEALSRRWAMTAPEGAVTWGF